MEFDYTLEYSGIDYGVVSQHQPNRTCLKGENSRYFSKTLLQSPRGDRVVFIKAGLGGGHYGCEQKYLRIAHRLRDKYGYSVIVGSNPNDGNSHTMIDKAMLDGFVDAEKITLPRFSFFGHSNGGIKGLELAASGICFDRMVLVNTPLMINYHKTKRMIGQIPNTQITMVYGEYDPSFDYIPFFDGKFNNVSVLKIPGADHNFSDMLDDFIALADMLAE